MIEPPKKTGLLALLDSWEPIDDEFPEIDEDLPPPRDIDLSDHDEPAPPPQNKREEAAVFPPASTPGAFLSAR